MWGPIIEKVFAKLKGSYMATDGGKQENALRYLTNAPVFTYWMSDIKDDKKLDEFWNIWKEG